MWCRSATSSHHSPLQVLLHSPGSHAFPTLLQEDHGKGGRDGTASARGKQGLSRQLALLHHVWLRKHLGTLTEVNAKRFESSFHSGSPDAWPNHCWCQPSHPRVWQTSLSREVSGTPSFRRNANPRRTASLQYVFTFNSHHGQNQTALRHMEKTVFKNNPSNLCWDLLVASLEQLPSSRNTSVSPHKLPPHIQRPSCHPHT